MSDEKRAADLMEAYNPMWDMVVDNTILCHVPEAEVKQVRDILMLLRQREVINAFRYARKNSSTKASAKFLQNLKEYSEAAADITLPQILND